VHRLPAALPQWRPPVEVIETRCYWNLPQHLVPVAGEGRLRPSFPTAGQRREDSLLKAAVRFTHAAFGREADASAGDVVRREWEAWQRADRHLPFAVFLQRLQGIGGDKAPAVVIDLAALVREYKTLPASGSDLDDLVLIGCRNLVVVTTATAMADSGTSAEGEFERRFGAAAVQAAALGRDASGRFCDLGEAARLARRSLAHDSAGLPLLAHEATADAWEDADPATDLWCIHYETPHLLGIVLALTLLVAGLWLGRLAGPAADRRATGAALFAAAVAGACCNSPVGGMADRIDGGRLGEHAGGDKRPGRTGDCSCGLCQR
jgi:hypothetical protein